MSESDVILLGHSTLANNYKWPSLVENSTRQISKNNLGNISVDSLLYTSTRGALYSDFDMEGFNMEGSLVNAQWDRGSSARSPINNVEQFNDIPQPPSPSCLCS